MTDAQKLDGRRRVIIENVQPEIDSGRFPIKRIVGQNVAVEADAFTDSHDALICVLRYRHSSEPDWHEVSMLPLGNDRWHASFPLGELGLYVYTITAWIDHFFSWQQEFVRRNDAQDIALALRGGAKLVEEAAARAIGENQLQLQHFARELLSVKPDAGAVLACSHTLANLMRQHSDRSLASDYPHLPSVWSEPVKAQYSTWYEFFPRSCVGDDMAHGNFAECEKRLPYIADMGFDVVYLPPIHPIGLSNRKGSNNTLVASDADVGSPWAIGAAEGGHKSIHPQLGTLEDFQRLVMKARELGIDIALDIFLYFMDLLHHFIQRRCHSLMHQVRHVSLNKVWRPPVAAKQLLQFLAGNAGKQRRVGNFVAVEMQDRQHGAIGYRIQKLVRMPSGGKRPCFSFSVSNDASDNEIGVVEYSPERMAERITQLASLVD